MGGSSIPSRKPRSGGACPARPIGKGLIQVTVTNEQSALRVDRRRLAAAVRWALEGQGLNTAEISLAVVDDPRIHQLNRQFLRHDYPTDVLSFLLEQADGYLEGEVIVSAERAVAECGRYGWGPAEELLLYVVHGTLHLAGCDDARPELRRKMRAREKACLDRLGVASPGRRPATAGKRAKRGEPPR